MKPCIGITMGDPAGIGPEIIVKALNHARVFSECRPLVIGEKGILEQALRSTGMGLNIQVTVDPAKAAYRHGTITLLNKNNIDSRRVVHGSISAQCGKAAGEFIEEAVKLACNREIDAITTAPIHKESFDLGGYGKKYRGHTEMLAALTHSKDVAMLLVSGNLRVIHVTTHLSMRRALDQIKQARIYRTIRIAHLACRQLGVDSPRIGVAGLNPHCGEGGIMGDEEMTEIIPAVEAAARDGLEVTGPVPADTIFPRGKSGRFDIIVAMYHDQGHIPVKLLGFESSGESWSSIRGVNITFGLPIIRTSVDHGTAFGKAGKGTADEGSLLDAIHYACILAQNKLRGNPN